mmetsp:Transcript_18984/g.55090  ORF Transcript_18984/g.55090 Transcript_18984/m.55090 type:complete len:93 (-) Transcript_18984:609-887(-)
MGIMTTASSSSSTTILARREQSERRKGLLPLLVTPERQLHPLRYRRSLSSLVHWRVRILPQPALQESVSLLGERRTFASALRVSQSGHIGLK